MTLRALLRMAGGRDCYMCEKPCEILREPDSPKHGLCNECAAKCDCQNPNPNNDCRLMSQECEIHTENPYPKRNEIEDGGSK